MDSGKQGESENRKQGEKFVWILFLVVKYGRRTTLIEDE